MDEFGPSFSAKKNRNTPTGRISPRAMFATLKPNKIPKIDTATVNHNRCSQSWKPPVKKFEKKCDLLNRIDDLKESVNDLRSSREFHKNEIISHSEDAPNLTAKESPSPTFIGNNIRNYDFSSLSNDGLYVHDASPQGIFNLYKKDILDSSEELVKNVNTSGINDHSMPSSENSMPEVFRQYEEIDSYKIKEYVKENEILNIDSQKTVTVNVYGNSAYNSSQNCEEQNYENTYAINMNKCNPILQRENKTLDSQFLPTNSQSKVHHEALDDNESGSNIKGESIVRENVSHFKNVNNFNMSINDDENHFGTVDSYSKNINKDGCHLRNVNNYDTNIKMDGTLFKNIDNYDLNIDENGRHIKNVNNCDMDINMDESHFKSEENTNECERHFKNINNYEININKNENCCKSVDSYDYNTDENGRHLKNMNNYDVTINKNQYYFNNVDNYDMNIKKDEDHCESSSNSDMNINKDEDNLKNAENCDMNINKDGNNLKKAENYDMNINDGNNLKNAENYDMNINKDGNNLKKAENYDMNINDGNNLKNAENYDMNINKDGNQFKNMINYDMNTDEDITHFKHPNNTDTFKSVHSQTFAQEKTHFNETEDSFDFELTNSQFLRIEKEAECKMKIKSKNQESNRTCIKDSNTSYDTSFKELSEQRDILKQIIKEIDEINRTIIRATMSLRSDTTKNLKKI